MPPPVNTKNKNRFDAREAFAEHRAVGRRLPGAATGRQQNRTGAWPGSQLLFHHEEEGSQLPAAGVCNSIALRNLSHLPWLPFRSPFHKKPDSEGQMQCSACTRTQRSWGTKGLRSKKKRAHTPFANHGAIWNLAAPVRTGTPRLAVLWCASTSISPPSFRSSLKISEGPARQHADTSEGPVRNTSVAVRIFLGAARRQQE